MEQHAFLVRRTARYVTIGPRHGDVRRVWFVLHGYGQLAAHFIRRFDVLDDGQTLIVAPEALSRFYLPAPPGQAAPVGASWMTREDRLAEIDDYLTYLNDLSNSILKDLDAASVRVTLLGFSQGTATVSRWAAAGHVPCHRLVLWAGTLANDLRTYPDWQRLQTIPVQLVYGDQDAFINPDDVASHLRECADWGIAPRVVRFVGKHEVTREVITQLADLDDAR